VAEACVFGGWHGVKGADVERVFGEDIKVSVVLLADEVAEQFFLGGAEVVGKWRW
jgi:hypothetical protein